MSFLSPEKLLVIFVVIMIVIGPEKLPAVAKQLGVALETLRTFHAKIEGEVRESVPNLPSTRDIAKMARSPAAFLTTLVDTSDDPKPDPGATAHVAEAAEDWPIDTGAPVTMPSTNGIGNGNGSTPVAVDALSTDGPPVFGDPSMN